MLLGWPTFRVPLLAYFWLIVDSLKIEMSRVHQASPSEIQPADAPLLTIFARRLRKLSPNLQAGATTGLRLSRF